MHPEDELEDDETAPEPKKKPRGRPRKHPKVVDGLVVAPDQTVEDAKAIEAARFARRRQEWYGWGLSGVEKTVASKIDVLAHIEDHYELVSAARAANVLRRDVERWITEDPRFAEAVDEAMECCVAFAGSLMYRAAVQPNAKGQINTGALIMFLNNNDPSYGVIKAQLIERRDKRLINRMCDEILAERIPTAEIDAVRAALERISAEEILGTAAASRK